MTAAEIQALNTKALLAYFNKLTGKNVKRFASHADGLRRTLAAQTKQNAGGTVGSTPGAAQKAAEVLTKSGAVRKPRVVKAKAPKPKLAKARTVRGSASDTIGRPKLDFIVQLTEANASSKPQELSDRMKLIVYLRKTTMQHKGKELAQAARFSVIEAQDDFKGINMKGVVQKLADKGWVEKVSLA